MSLAAASVGDSSQLDAQSETDDVNYICSACNEILEEGKAYELGGRRWHLDCFRCNTCDTLLGSDANLLVLADGSLICNNCTYSCAGCKKKIDDLAIITGDQAFCANCFKCRNCKRSIDNLRYARTSQGIFCMDCHEALMARRRKRTVRNAVPQKQGSVKGPRPHHMHLDKSLPSLPPNADQRDTGRTTPSSDHRTVHSSQPSTPRERARLSKGSANGSYSGVLYLSKSVNNLNYRDSQLSRFNDDEEYLVPVAFDPNPLPRSVSNTKTQSQSNRVSTPPVLPPIGSLSLGGDNGGDLNSSNAFSVARFSWPNSPRLDDDEAKNESIPAPPVTKEQEQQEPVRSRRESQAAAEETRGIEWYKARLEEEQERASQLTQNVAELQRKVNVGENIQATNIELKEKRSTVHVLEAQREMAMRELKILLEHAPAGERSAATRESSTTNDFPGRISANFPTSDSHNVDTLTKSVLRNFARQLEELRNSFEPEIESRIKKRTELDGELVSLNRRLTAALQQFEQVSTKSAELTAMNNIMVREIQSLYQINKITPSDLALDMMRLDKKVAEIPSDSSSLIASDAPSKSEHSQGNDSEHGSQDLRVVSIPKSQPRKFIWKKTGQKGKGRRGAFLRDGPAVVDTSVNGEPGLQDQSSAPVNLHDHRNGNPAGAVRQGFAFFANQRRNVTKKDHLPSDRTATTGGTGSTGLFGVELERRVDIEHALVPRVVTSCIDEVERRGVKVEGIYRKSGSNTQVETICDGFERHNNSSLMSDPDLDIHAVTGCLKKYIRDLPTSIITLDVYEHLLEATCGSSVNPNPSEKARITATRNALQMLPRAHADLLECLVRHLRRVVDHEKDNLMTSVNVAVVFAPSILPQMPLAQEMSDVQRKKQAVKFILDHCDDIFPDSE